MADKYITQYFTEFEKAPAALRKKYGDIDAFYDATNSDCAPKYDGCCGVALLHGGRMLSRTGEDYSHSVQHILKELTGLVGSQEAVIIGEVWHPAWAFQEISGTFRRVPKTDADKVAAEELIFVVHDFLTLEEWMMGGTGVPHKWRTDWAFTAWHGKRSSVYLEGELAPPKKPGEAPTEYARRLKEYGGFDGCIVRTKDMPYYPGQTDKGTIFKVKPTYSLDLLVIDKVVIQQPTKLGGQIIVRMPDGQQQAVGSGLTQANLKDTSQWAGKIAEVEFMGYTEDRLMREPRLKGLRHDKLSPD